MLRLIEILREPLVLLLLSGSAAVGFLAARFLGTRRLKRVVLEQAHLVRRYAAEALTDPLTTLMNRRAFDQMLARRVGECRRRRMPVCLLLLDVDLFKRINDTHGHASGDTVLIKLSRLLRLGTREFDQVARLGGDEFAVILMNVGLDEARSVVERLRQTVHQECRVNGQQVSISCGLTQLTRDDTARLALERADTALYAAKQRGRNQLAVQAENTAANVDEVPPAATDPADETPPLEISGHLK